MTHKLSPPQTDSEALIAANAYDTATREGGWDSPERAQELVEKYVDQGTTILDIGIGTGQAVEGYAKKGAAIIGLDHDPEMLRIAQEVTGDAGYMQIADINGHLPLGDLQGRVDVAQAIGVLEFASNLSDLIDQVKAALKRGGVFVFTTETPTEGAKTTEYFDDAGVTVYRHSAGEVRTLLSEKGFTLIFDEAYGGYERGGAAKVPYHIFLAQKSEDK